MSECKGTTTYLNVKGLTYLDVGGLEHISECKGT